MFDPITRRALQLCNGTSVGLFEFDGNLVYARASSGGNQVAIAAFQGMFPMEPTRESLACRAMLDRHIIHIPDMNAKPGLHIPDLTQALDTDGARELVGADIRARLAVPLLREPAGEVTGLRLSFSYDIVIKQHGGQLNVDSQADAFTEFVITLPRKMPASDGGRI